MRFISLDPYPVRFAFTSDEKAFRKLMRRLQIGGVEMVSGDSDATTHCMSHPEHGGLVVIGVSDMSGAPLAQVASMVAHEAMHAVQFVWEFVGERSPGKEAEAYLLQMITQYCLLELGGFEKKWRSTSSNRKGASRQRESKDSKKSSSSGLMSLAA